MRAQPRRVRMPSQVGVALGEETGVVGALPRHLRPLGLEGAGEVLHGRLELRALEGELEVGTVVEAAAAAEQPVVADVLDAARR